MVSMTRCLAHRGPDGEGIMVDQNVAFGHRRLAIIDLSKHAAQPMSSADAHYVLTYNGEIYNYKELKSELINRRYTFTSNSDSEVLLYTLIEWGMDALNKLNGMFAFAFYDKRNRQIFLARDRYGIKPLYYGCFNNSFYFASEHKAILAAPGVHLDVDTEALFEYFTFQNIFTDRTLCRGIKTFPPGCYGVLTLDGMDSSRNNLKISRYWDFDFGTPSEARDENEYVEELDRLFTQAISRQMVSDVPVGAYLSGGVDSGSITAVAASHVPYIKSFTCGFDLHSASGLEVVFDERQAAEYMSYLFKTEHYEMVLKAGDMERVMPKLVWHMEEPRVGQSYPNYYVSQLASRFVKVCLSGAGGDELFAGYPWRYYRAVINDNFEQYIDKYYLYWKRLIPNSILHNVFAPIWGDVQHVWTRDIFRNVFKHHHDRLSCPEDYVQHSLYFEARTFLSGLLHVEDKLSMAHGLETRVPFLDNDLVDFATKIPLNLKLKNLGEVIRLNENEVGSKTSKYFTKTRDGKLILRNVMSRYVPNEVSNGIKQGFSGPDASWFKGESLDYVKRELLSSDARIYDYMDKSSVQGLINEHLSGQQNRRLLIWSLLYVEWWLRIYRDKQYG